jgi:acyl-CoA thioesterase YciA
MSNENCKNGPDGHLMLRTKSMPKDSNANGDIFGGWIMSQIDLAGAIMANELTRGRVVTIAAEKITFKHPIKIGDVICCYAKVVHVGTTSLGIHIEVWARSNSSEPISRIKVTECVFTYVAIDEEGKKRKFPQFIYDNKERLLEEGYIEF